MAMIAPAWLATSFSRSRAVRSPIRRKLPLSFTRMAPSTTSTNLLSFSLTASASDFSAWYPAAAIRVSL
jgi:hypothetical protein